MPRVVRPAPPTTTKWLPRPRRAPGRTSPGTDPRGRGRNRGPEPGQNGYPLGAIGRLEFLSSELPITQETHRILFQGKVSRQAFVDFIHRMPGEECYTFALFEFSKN